MHHIFYNYSSPKFIYNRADSSGTGVGSFRSNIITGFELCGGGGAHTYPLWMKASLVADADDVVTGHTTIHLSCNAMTCLDNFCQHQAHLAHQNALRIIAKILE